MRQVFSLAWSILGLVFVMSSGAAAAEPGIPCPGSCVPVCPTFYIAEPYSEVIATSTPSLGFFQTTIWAQCNSTNCCGSVTCSLNFGQRTVQVGAYNNGTWSKIESELPAGYTTDPSLFLKRYGSVNVVVPAQNAGTCTLGKCQNTDWKAGPGYITVAKTLIVIKVCLKNVGSGCGLFSGEPCLISEFQDYSSARYLIPSDVLVTGSCGNPWPGCGSCSNPAQPNCP